MYFGGKICFSLLIFHERIFIIWMQVFDNLVLYKVSFNLMGIRISTKKNIKYLLLYLSTIKRFICRCCFFLPYALYKIMTPLGIITVRVQHHNVTTENSSVTPIRH